NFVLGLSAPQMDRPHDYGTVVDNQLRTLGHIGLLRGIPAAGPSEQPRLVDPYDRSQPLEDRARSYLHTNCAICHVEAGGGNAAMQLDLATPSHRMRLIGHRP